MYKKDWHIFALKSFLQVVLPQRCFNETSAHTHTDTHSQTPNPAKGKWNQLSQSYDIHLLTEMQLIKKVERQKCTTPTTPTTATATQSTNRTLGPNAFITKWCASLRASGGRGKKRTNAMLWPHVLHATGQWRVERVNSLKRISICFARDYY